jgi:hypothetical protein
MDLGTERATEGSPLPRLPWGLHSDGTLNPDGTQVKVWLFGKPEEAITIPLLDDGPGKQATKNPKDPHAIDLTRAAFVKLGGNLRAGTMRVGFKIEAAA